MLSGSYIVASLIWLFLSTDPADSVPWRSLLSVGLSEGCGFDPRREWHIIVVSSRGAMVARQTSMLWACHLSSFLTLGPDYMLCFSATIPYYLLVTAVCSYGV